MIMMADTTTSNAQVRSLYETVRLDANIKFFHPKCYDGILLTGYEGVRNSKASKKYNWMMVCNSK